MTSLANLMRNPLSPKLVPVLLLEVVILPKVTITDQAVNGWKKEFSFMLRYTSTRVLMAGVRKGVTARVLRVKCGFTMRLVLTEGERFIQIMKRSSRSNSFYEMPIKMKIRELLGVTQSQIQNHLNAGVCTILLPTRSLS